VRRALPLVLLLMVAACTQDLSPRRPDAAPTPGPTPSGPIPTLAEGEAVDYEEALAYMRELTGSDCASTANATLVLTDAVIGDAEAVPSGSNQWVRSGIWHGSSDALINELGGTVIAEHDSYVWLLLNAEGGPYAQLLQRAVTPGGEQLWFVAGTVNSLDETECQ
jgi:hypothetical protein